MNAYLVPFAEVGRGDTTTVGGKGANLGELSRAGLPVPPGFVVTTAAFEEAMAAVDPVRRHRRRIAGLDPDDLDTVARVTGDLRRRIVQAPVPDPMCHLVRAGYRQLAPAGAAPVAIRSSATGEDGADASFAGLQDSYLWVQGEESVLRYARQCWASLYSVESVTYRLRRRLPEEELAMGVVVQRMVDPRCAGVMFTRSPLSGDRSVVVVEAAWGLGSALVSGDVTPDRFVVGKVTGEVVTRVVSRKLRRHRRDPSGAGVVDEPVPADLQRACCLTDSELDALVTVGKRIEAHYGAPQDIEWAVTGPTPGSPAGDEPGEHLFLLQSRPETRWARGDAAPVTAPRPRAFDHVLDRLSVRP